MKRPYLFFLTALLAVPALQAKAETLTYEVSMDEPWTHYFDVTLTVEGVEGPTADLQMAVWTPGSYKVRDYAKNVEAVTAADGKGRKLPASKINKNTWRVETGDAETLVFRYKVYAFEHSVRHSYLDASHGYINGASVFVYLAGKQELPATVKVKPYEGWEKVSCGLPTAEGDPFTLLSPNFDILVDSPMEIGNHKVMEFQAGGVPHYIAFYGDLLVNEREMVADFKRIAEEHTEVFGTDHPCQSYTFIIHSVASGGGGLEHLNSTSCIYPRFAMLSNYVGYLGLISHEYFHLWNVKRIRPENLGPFDYTQENYTRLLWEVEGLTSYYDDLVLQRSGVISEESYLGVMSGNITSIERKPGNRVQSVAEASFDAWIKYYEPSENDQNSEISYYTKGAVLHALLDLAIIHHSGGEKSMDDVLRYLYQEYHLKQKRGFSEEEYRAALEKMAGTDFGDFLDDYVYGTEPIDYDKYFAYAGLRLEKNPAQYVSLGVSLEEEGDRLTISSIKRSTSAYDSGLNVGDEIIAIDGYRMSESLIGTYVSTRRAGEKATVTVSRDGKLQEIEVTLKPDPYGASYSIVQADNPTKKQLNVLRKWLGR